jgi:sugar (pentulose or hexulose) kinase
MADLFLVLNLGLKSVRSIIFDLDGRKLANASLPVQTALKGDRVEQDPMEWWEKGLQVMAETCRYRRLGQDVRYITVTASSSCLLPTGEDGKPLCPAIMVSDKRAEEQAVRLGGMDDFVRVEQSTGLRADASLMLPKMLWLKEHMPEVAQGVRWYLSPNDFLVFCLSGRVVTDVYNAQKYHYDLRERVYPGGLLDALGIPSGALPEVEDPGVVIGPVLSGVAKQVGLSVRAEVVLSTYDAICAFHGSGPRGVGEACDVSGTVTSLRAYAQEVQGDDLHGLQCTPWRGGGLSIVGGSNNLGGGLIEWSKQCFFSREDYPYEVMEKEAKESSYGARGLVFLPYLMGERAPLWDAAARGVFFGLERYHTRGDMAEAVFESAGFAIRSLLEAIEACGVEVGTIRVSGGLTRVSHVSQLKADITGREIAVVDEFETTALGAALISAVGVGLIPDVIEASKRVRVRMVIHPDEQRYRMFQQLYQLYKETYDALKPVFLRRRELLSGLRDVVEASITNL